MHAGETFIGGGTQYEQIRKRGDFFLSHTIQMHQFKTLFNVKNMKIT